MLVRAVAAPGRARAYCADSQHAVFSRAEAAARRHVLPTHFRKLRLSISCALAAAQPATARLITSRVIVGLRCGG
ncbi:hypothetical protein DFR29_104198 [Tahibacter aquaticus]|uniref:Uncharacterized protein n=1 Tax=Tahibacter aquaticus TaxID=520092 RepID=A0A4R6Z2G1_9GAMM|nr:hypothetical protein DFR29_104198 [Tahibacter aquaticus]